MMSYTHSAFGILLFIFIGGALGIELSIPILAIVAIFSLLPDIDHPKSVLGMLFFPISSYISKKYGHRTITHSGKFLAGVMLSSLPLALLNWHYSLAISIAVLSHLVADGFNVSGVPLAYPNTRPYYFLPEKLLVKVGSPAELLFFIAFVFFIFAFGGVAIFGFRSFIHAIMPSFAGTVSEYGKKCDGQGNKNICYINASVCDEYCGNINGMILGIYNGNLILHNNITGYYYLTKFGTKSARLIIGNETSIIIIKRSFDNEDFQLEYYENSEGLVTIHGEIHGKITCKGAYEIWPVFSLGKDTLILHSMLIDDLKKKSCAGRVETGTLYYKIRQS